MKSRETRRINDPLPTDDCQTDPDLAAVKATWRQLPEALRAGLAQWQDIPEAIQAAIESLFKTVVK